MWFSKKKTKTELKAARFTSIVEETQKKIVEIGKIPDAGERYLALTDIETKIQGQVEDENKKFSEKKSKNANRWGGAGLGVVGAGVTLAFVTANPLFLLLTPVVGISAIAGGQNLNEASAEKTHAEDLENFFNPLNDLLKKVVEQKEIILRSELSGIEVSPHFDELFDNFLSVRDAFTKAAIKENTRGRPMKLDKPFPPSVSK